jgi:precorrin-6x reductase
MNTVRKYAEGTDVAADKSRAELERLLDKHGASEVGVHRDADKTTLIYRMKGIMVRHVVVYPEAKLFARKPDVKKAQEAEWRRRWRAQVLITKAKLELIASGESSVEREFLADTLLPNGETVAEAMLPRIAEAYATGAMPRLLLGPGGKNG